ncbi:hypothetical protein TanjilG_23989 [Lupinus angustifolius]|nr:hypothetical protein TanjilG_13790 [Lupinus angustifolius]OIV94595.1 hypothetical protein TanjilG_25657 [Lupinus angustifolius]OIW19163.1 hypothetical protein TanjilG_13945 [Lupinus angustifolius]OIW19937.1 hypothetical protein TanjilG_30851 [Lupinus angustifolius]OIW20829.1 hypothetical protein TanjilG_23989 [Lupinus angustifolius]
MSTHTDSSPIPSITTLPLNLHFNLHHVLPLLLLLFILIQFPPPATAQLPNTLTPPPPDNTISNVQFNKSMVMALVILVVVFVLLGFVSVYTRQCTERRMRGRHDLSIPIIGSNHRPRGLDREIIETFPTFIYSTVKSLKIGMATLECAVCLNEFQDDEKLRLIPVCNHVFHAECIDAWLVNHSTCPVCRANLVSTPSEVVPFMTIQLPDQTDPEPDPVHVDEFSGRQGTVMKESPKLSNNNSVNQNRPRRSRSTGFRFTNLLPRSHSLVQRGENLERFTLRLPEEVRNQLVTSTLSRTKSLGVAFTPESSERRGYRTRSVGSGCGRNNLERLDQSDRRMFRWMSRAGSNISKKVTEFNKDDVGERSSDRLFSGKENDM